MIMPKNTYCPKCFEMSLTPKKSGKIQLSFDGKRKESSHFLYNLDTNTEEELQEILVKKLIDFFKWYGSFEHKQSIKKVEITSADFICEEGCNLPGNLQNSIINILIPEQFFEDSVNDIAGKYGVDLD